MKSTPLLGAETGYRLLIVAVIVIGVAWRMLFLLDNSFWVNLVQNTPNVPIQAWMVFLVTLYASMICGYWFMYKTNLKISLILFMAGSLVLAVLMRLVPGFQAAYISYALFGLMTGAVQIPLLYYGGFQFPVKGRTAMVALFLLGMYGLVYLAMNLLPVVGFDALLAACGVLLAAAILLCSRLRPIVLPENAGDYKGAVSLKLVMTTGITLSIGYFLSFLTEVELFKSGFPINQSLTWLEQIIRLTTCLAFIFIGIRIKIFHLLYVTLVVTALAHFLSIAHVGADIPAYLMSNVSGVLLLLSFYTLATAIVSRYPRRPLVLSFLTLCGGIAVILGNTTGMTLSVLLEANPVLLYSLPVIIFVTVFFMLPLLFRSVKEEADLDQVPLDRGGKIRSVEKTKSAAPTAAPPLADRFASLNEHYDKENRLTGREMEIAALLAERYDYETIANRLFISMNTLKVHIKNIYRKYDLSGRKDLIGLVGRKEQTAV
jgi:DNA-binding CsgD family transcriptional regulator